MLEKDHCRPCTTDQLEMDDRIEQCGFASLQQLPHDSRRLLAHVHCLQDELSTFRNFRHQERIAVQDLASLPTHNCLEPSS